MIEPWPQATCAENFVKCQRVGFLDMPADRQTDPETDIQTCGSQYFAPPRGRNTNNDNRLTTVGLLSEIRYLIYKMDAAEGLRDAQIT